MKVIGVLAVAIFLLGFVGVEYSFSDCGVCGIESDHPAKSVGDHPQKAKGDHPAKAKGDHPTKSDAEKSSCFGGVCSLAEEKGGIKEITYDQFQEIRASGEDYVLVDALSAESYAKGHIEGAINFSYKDISHKTAPLLLDKEDNIIVYCGGFECAASTKAAHRLQALGYDNTVDYKGGLEDWQAQGNELVQ